MTAVIVFLGATAGAGIWVAVAALWPYRPDLATEVALLETARQPFSEPSGTVGPVSVWADRFGLPSQRTRADLACLDESVADHLRHLAQAAGAAAVGALVFSLMLIGAGLADVTLAVGLTVLAGVIAPVFATVRLHRRAEAEREEYRRALSVFLDAVAISLAGSAGIDTALDEAVSVGQGRQFDRIRSSLHRARLLVTTPWATLADLGERIGVAEYRQLAATVGLAATEGAGIRASLTDRAETLRTRRLTVTEARAASATEKMSLPIVALATAFLTLIIYAAMASVFASV